MRSALEIDGGTLLVGTTVVDGSKNAALPFLAGSGLPVDFADPIAFAAELDRLRTDTVALTEIRTAGLRNAARYPLSQTVRRLTDLSDQLT